MAKIDIVKSGWLLVRRKMMKQLVEADATESKEEIIPFYVHCLKTT